MISIKNDNSKSQNIWEDRKTRNHSDFSAMTFSIKCLTSRKPVSKNFKKKSNKISQHVGFPQPQNDIMHVQQIIHSQKPNNLYGLCNSKGHKTFLAENEHGINKSVIL